MLTLTRSWGTPPPYPNSALWLIRADSWDSAYYKVPSVPQPFLPVTMEDSFMWRDVHGHFHALFQARHACAHARVTPRPRCSVPDLPRSPPHSDRHPHSHTRVLAKQIALAARTRTQLLRLTVLLAPLVNATWVHRNRRASPASLIARGAHGVMVACVRSASVVMRVRHPLTPSRSSGTRA